MVCTEVSKNIRHVFFYLIPIRKKIVLSNLSLCFPEKSESWKLGITRECYINTAIILFEIFYLPKINKELLRKTVTFENTDIIFESLKKGNGLFMLGGHIANWELQASALSRILGARINGVAKPQSNKLVNKKIIEYRESAGSRVIEIGGSLRSIYTLLKNNEIVLFLMDQSANPDYSVFTEFFGHKIATFTGPAKMALKNRTDIIFAYSVRQKNYSYAIRTERLVYDDLKEYNDENIAELTRRINIMLENVIRENPGQWHWFHRRFKHRKN